MTGARQEIYFEEEECVSGVRDKRATFYVVNCTRATRATRIDPRPKDTQTRRRLSLVATMPERLSPKVTRNMTGLEGFSPVSRLVASICVPLPPPPPHFLSELSDATVVVVDRWSGSLRL